jgi:hypothetical protein
MNRLEWILGIILVVLLLAVGALSLTFWFRNDRTPVSAPDGAANSATTIAERADDIAPTPEYDGRSALVAYAAAQKRALEWQPDAQLVTAQATWPQGATSDYLAQGRESWGFTFYAPTAGRIALFSVVADVVSLISERDHQQTSPLLSVSGWNLDSNEAVRIFLQEGGHSFLADQDVTTMTMSLLASDVEENGRLEWQIALFSPQTGQTFTMLLDATSGEVLSTNS